MGHRDIWGPDSKNWKKWCPCFDAKGEYAYIGTIQPVVEEVEEVTEVESEPEEIEPVKRPSFVDLIIKFFKLFKK